MGKTLWHLPIYCIAEIIRRWGAPPERLVVRRNTNLLCSSLTHCNERCWKDSLSSTWERKKRLPLRKQRFGAETADVTGGIKRKKSESQQWPSVLVPVGVYFARLAVSAGPKTFRLFPAPVHVKAVIK